MDKSSLAAMFQIANQYPQLAQFAAQLPKLNLGVQNTMEGYRAPEISGQATVPFAGGEFGIGGQVQPGAPNMSGSPLFGARAEYRRRF